MLLQKETLDDFCKKVYLTLYFIFRYHTFYIWISGWHNLWRSRDREEMGSEWGNERENDEIAKSIYNICRENLDILRKYIWIKTDPEEALQLVSACCISYFSLSVFLYFILTFMICCKNWGKFKLHIFPGNSVESCCRKAIFLKSIYSTWVLLIILTITAGRPWIAQITFGPSGPSVAEAGNRGDLVKALHIYPPFTF